MTVYTLLKLLFAVTLTGLTAPAVWADAPHDAPAVSQNPDCLRAPCRAPRTMRIRAARGADIQFSIARSPYLTKDGHIVIYPGEKLVFRIKDAAKQPEDLQFVRADNLPDLAVPDLSASTFDKMDKTDPNTFAIAEQIAEFKAHGSAAEQLKIEPPGTLIVALRPISGAVGAMLTVAHNFPQALKLKVFMMRPSKTGFELKYTDTCPIKPKMFGVETWREPLGGLILEDFRFLADGSAPSCE